MFVFFHLFEDLFWIMLYLLIFSTNQSLATLESKSDDGSNLIKLHPRCPNEAV